jgi:ribokinase
MTEFDVVVVGSLNLDLVAHAERLPLPGETIHGSSFAEFAGGKGLNQAVAAARSGARVAMVGAVGGDHAGIRLREVVGREGIDDSFLVTVESAPTGRALISVDERGENSIIVVAGANGSVEISELPDSRVVLAQLEIDLDAVVAAMRIARSRGAMTILNPAPAGPLAADLVGLCDMVVPNEHEVGLLGGADALLARGVGSVIVTRGAAGVDLVRDGVDLHVPPFLVEPVDTTGAGDAFCGALACELALGDDLPAAMHFAAAAGALATTRHGAVPSQPTRGETLALAASRPVARPGSGR